MPEKDVAAMSPEEVRAALAADLQSLITIRRMLADTAERAAALQARLVNPEDGARMQASEGVPTRYGVLKRVKVTKGKAYPQKDEIEKDAGELPEALQPTKDERVVIEHLSDVPTGVAAELRLLSGGEDPAVKITPKVKLPTVAALRKEFGEDTKYVGKPPVENLVVLAKDAGDDEILMGIDGMVS